MHHVVCIPLLLLILLFGLFSILLCLYLQTDVFVGFTFMQDFISYQNYIFIIIYTIFLFILYQTLTFIIFFNYKQTQATPMKTLKQLRLPLSLQNNPVATKIKGYLQMLGPTSGYFSSVLFQDKNKTYYLLKDKDFPYIPLDWSIYTLMRVNAKTIITSGSTLRKERWVYQDSRGTFDKEELKQLYQENAPKPFNFLVFTKKMRDQEIKNMVSSKYFKFISPKQIYLPSQKAEVQTFKQLADRVNQLEMGPTIYENGEKTLSLGLNDVKQGQKSFTELIVLNKYHGPMPEKYIGKQYDTKMLSRDFDKVWQSQVIKTQAQMSGEKQQKNASLQFQVYLRKDKIKSSKN